MKAKNAFVVVLLLLYFPNLFAQVQGPLNGSNFQNIAIPNSTSTWTTPGNGILSDNLYATNTTNLGNPNQYTDYLQATGFSFTIPNGGIINGIQVDVERSDPNGKAKDYRIRIVKNGTIGIVDKSVNAAWHNSDQYITYGGSNDVWGQTWTAADINASNFGFAIAVIRQGGGNNVTLAKIDHIRITVYYSSILPIEISNFIAFINENKGVIQWTTASEKNNDYFTLEHSNDGILFSPIAEIKGAGTSHDELSYEFIDRNMKSGYNYYRIKQTDYDQTTSYSSIVVVNNILSIPFSVDLYPDSSYNSDLTIKFNGLKENEKTIVLLELIDLSGRICASQLIEVSSLTTSSTFFIQNNLTANTYIMRATSPYGYVTKKIKL